MDASDRVDAVYRKYPELAKIDRDLVGVRTSRMICAVEHDKEPLPALEKREKDLLEQRQKFLKERGIPSNFEDMEVFCVKCGDTGYVKAKDGRDVVCTACMKDALEEVFPGSGLKDFATYTLKGFKLDYYQDNGARASAFEGIRNLIAGNSEKKLMLLSSGVQTGKTYMAVVSCKYAIMQGKSAYYIKADNIFRLSKEETEDMKEYDFVVIDDFSAAVTSYENSTSKLHEILEARLASARATVIVSSSSLDTLINDSDERIAGKLKFAGTL